MRAAYCTLGCKVNQYDTDAMREIMERAGYETVDFSDVADVYLINTCTVTATGDKKSRQMISRAHKINPMARIIVAGCYAQQSPEKVSELPGVSLVIGTKDRARVAELLMQSVDAPVCAVSDIRTDHSFEPLSAVKEGRTRAHLKIQEGCDRYCTYCIIPYARGALKSRPFEDIVFELEKLAREGYKEVVLTGIHLMSYGKEAGDKNLNDIIRAAQKIGGIERIRLGSLEPQLANAEFTDTVRENGKVCPQFHLSLQSGCDTVLKRMNRRYDTQDYMRCVEALRQARPGCAITTDIIVGFPGETAEEFAETMKFARQVGFSRIHVFPYSRREGTPAARMKGQLTNAEKSARASQLISLAEELESAYMGSLIGKRVSVLFETEKEGFMEGYTDTYVRARMKGDISLSGSIKCVNASALAGGYIVCE